jgi:hypothetical protein
MTEDQIERIQDRIGASRVFKMLLLTACLGYLLDAFDNSLIGYATSFPLAFGVVSSDSSFGGDLQRREDACMRFAEQCLCSPALLA